MFPKHVILYMIKVKGTFHPRTAHEGPKGEYRYSYTLSLTSALDGVGGQRHDPAALHPGKRPDRYPLYRRLGEPQSRSGRVRKISSPPGFDSRTVQPVASRYTARAIPANFIYGTNVNQMTANGEGYQTLLCVAVDTASYQHRLEAPTVCGARGDC
jgi:hypothetical protein